MNPLGADQFFWADNAWYYLYGWSPGVGWDAGHWLRGRDLCNVVMGSSATWFAIWSNNLQRMALYDTANFTAPAVCGLTSAENAPPGTVIA